MPAPSRRARKRRTTLQILAHASEGGLLLTINGKTGWREVEIGRGSRPDTCPVVLLETWMRLGRVNQGPLFRPIARKNGGVSSERLTDKHVARLVQKTALAAGIRGDLSEGERKRAFGGHSLRAGLASSAQIEEAHVPEPPRPRQRRNDPPIPAETRPVQSQSHQGRRTVKAGKGFCNLSGTEAQG